MKPEGDEEFDLIRPVLVCEFHGEFKRELMICPKCYRIYTKRNKELMYERDIK